MSRLSQLSLNLPQGEIDRDALRKAYERCIDPRHPISFPAALEHPALGRVLRMAAEAAASKGGRRGS